MIFATLYLRYHYAADILAGGMLAALCALLAPRLIGYQRPTSWDRGRASPSPGVLGTLAMASPDGISFACPLMRGALGAG